MSSIGPSVSVVVCAYTLDRWEAVGAALRSAAGQDRAPDELILLVDHNDTLLSRARAELATTLPGLRVLTNERARGLSGARNTALLHALGEVVVFLDDDARAADDGWLGRLLAPYADPTVLGVGGTAQPDFPATGRPTSLPAAGDRGVLDWVIGCSFDGQPRVQGPVRNLMGCNMSLRREPALAAGGFSEHLGRVGKTPLGCEETELCIRMTAARPGSRMVFVPGATVRHLVTDDRVTWSYLRRRSYAEGLSKAAVAHLVGQDQALATERSYVSRVLPAAVGRGLVGVARPGPLPRGAHALGVAAVGLCLSATAVGYLRGRLAGHLDLDSARPPLAATVSGGPAV